MAQFLDCKREAQIGVDSSGGGFPGVARIVPHPWGRGHSIPLCPGGRGRAPRGPGASAPPGRARKGSLVNSLTLAFRRPRASLENRRAGRRDLAGAHMGMRGASVPRPAQCNGTSWGAYPDAPRRYRRLSPTFCGRSSICRSCVFYLPRVLWTLLDWWFFFERFLNVYFMFF